MSKCTAILPNIKFNDCAPAPVSTRFKYWHEETTSMYIKTACKQWFGKMLTNAQASEVLLKMSQYPAESREEAIETVLVIFLNK